MTDIKVIIKRLLDERMEKIKELNFIENVNSWIIKIQNGEIEDYGEIQNMLANAIMLIANRSESYEEFLNLVLKFNNHTFRHNPKKDLTIKYLRSLIEYFQAAKEAYFSSWEGL